MAEISERMTSAEQSTLLEGRHLAVITTIGPDGYPQSTPVWYMPDGDSVGIIADPDSVKVRNIRRNPRISITIASEGRPYRYILFKGDAELHTGGVDGYPGRMAERYLGREGGAAYIEDISPHPPFVVIKIRGASSHNWIDRNPLTA